MAGPRQDAVGIEAMARYLIRLRTRAGLTQTALAEKSEVAQNQINRYENRKQMASPEIRARLAKGLDLTTLQFELGLDKVRTKVNRELGGDDGFERGPIEGAADEVSERPRSDREPRQKIRAVVRDVLEGDHDGEAVYGDDLIDTVSESILHLLESVKRMHERVIAQAG